MTETVFVDTNVLIYALDQADLKKQERAMTWRALLWKSGRGRVSIQVLHEFYVKVTQKWPKAREDARSEILDLMAWSPVEMNSALLQLAWKFQDRYQLSFWDALIVAAAKTSSCRYLLTEDLQSDQDLDGVMVLNPFLHDPISILAQS
jgi:predicted nucleic acid-binding protein